MSDIYPPLGLLVVIDLEYFSSAIEERFKCGPPDFQIIVLLAGVSLPPPCSVYLFFFPSYGSESSQGFLILSSP